MTSFPLKIVTPDGLAFDGQAEYLIARTTEGDVGIRANHINSVFSLGMGKATIIIDGQRRTAACIGGMLSVIKGSVTLVPTTFEWSDQIDTNRANASYQRAQKILNNSAATETDLKLAEARLKRALIRINTATNR